MKNKKNEFHISEWHLAMYHQYLQRVDILEIRPYSHYTDEFTFEVDLEYWHSQGTRVGEA